MPLPPGGNTPWPPTHLRPAFDQMAVYAAWWHGDPEQLSAVYGGTADTSATSEHSFEQRGGLVGMARRVGRWFWGQTTPVEQQRTKVHVPLASDMASTSADLLFSRSIAVTFGDPEAVRKEHEAKVKEAEDKAKAETPPPDPMTGLPTGPAPEPEEVPDEEPDPAQQRFDHLREISGFDSTLLEAAEVAAALSGVYLRLCWDSEVQDGPFLDVVHPDSAVPEFRYGRLWAVTFWRELVSDDDRRNGKVVRHLERHERGAIMHGLYEGDRDTLGRKVPLTQAPDLEGLVDELTDGDTIEAVEGRLTACYVPNMRPNPAWRRNPQLAPLGRSDYTPGVLSLMDQLDEAWSSWMRDLRLGVARIMVPEQYLESHGKGKGASFDIGREVFTQLNMLPQPGGPPQITPNQFAIRVDEHERTCKALADQIARGAGYSAQTFGSDGEGQAATATEINARERRSVLTREKKIRFWDNALTELIYTWMLLDAAIGASTAATKPATPAADAKPSTGKDGKGAKKTADAPPPVEPDGPPTVEFPGLADADMLTLGQTAQAIFAASAASKYTLVKLLHPDWEETQVREELKRMEDDAAAGALSDPMAMGAEQPIGGGAPFGQQPADDEQAEDDKNSGGNPFG